MSRYGLLGVHVMVGIISCSIGLSTTEDSTKANIHPSKDEGNEGFLNTDTNPILGDSINSDKQRTTQSSIPDTSFETTLSDGGDARLHHTTAYPVLYDTTYDSRRHDTTDNSRLHQTTDYPVLYDTTYDSRRHSTTDDSRRHSTTDDSMRHDTTDNKRLRNTTVDLKVVDADTTESARRHNTTNDTKLHSTTDDTRFHDTTDHARLHNTTAGTSLHNTTDDTRFHDTTDHARLHDTTAGTSLHNTTNDTSLHNTTDDTSLHTTTDDTRFHDTTDHARAHNTTVDMNAVDAGPAFPNQTLSQRTDSAELSPLVRNVSFINESQMENQGNPEQLLFDTERISNASKFYNRTDYNDKNRNDTCFMIKNVTFILTLGRKMPLYIDIMSLVLGAIGIIGNLATITVVAFNYKLRKPYFLTILTLAVADLLSIIVMISTIFLEFDIAMYMPCFKPELYVFLSSFASIQMNSQFQVVLIAVIKFLLLVYPIKSRTYVTNNLIVALFFVIVLFSTCLSFLPFYLAMQKVMPDISRGIIILSILSSNLVIIILHCIKVAKLRKSQALQKEIQKMNKVVSIILSIFIVYNSQKLISPFMLKFSQNIELVHICILYKCLNISAFIHHGCNPLLYFAFTPFVQKPWRSLKEKFKKR